jgi:hypothetical protein
MAVEMYLKAFLVQKTGLSEAGGKVLGHRLSSLLKKCRHIAPDHDLLKIESDLAVFPEIHERYTGGDLPRGALWAAYGVAQYSAASVIRSFTTRDTRAQFLNPPLAL